MQTKLGDQALWVDYEIPRLGRVEFHVRAVDGLLMQFACLFVFLLLWRWTNSSVFSERLHGCRDPLIGRILSLRNTDDEIFALSDRHPCPS